MADKWEQVEYCQSANFTSMSLPKLVYVGGYFEVSFHVGENSQQPAGPSVHCARLAQIDSNVALTTFSAPVLASAGFFVVSSAMLRTAEFQWGSLSLRNVRHRSGTTSR